MEGSIEKIIDRLKNPKGLGLIPIPRGEALRDWIEELARGIFQSINYFFDGSTFQLEGEFYSKVCFLQHM